jgi:hypothetical protein
MAMPEWTDARLNDAFEMLRKDNAQLRDEMREDMRSLRAEITAEFRAFREEMRAETASVRADVRTELRTFWVVLISSYITLFAAFVATTL